MVQSIWKLIWQCVIGVVVIAVLWAYFSWLRDQNRTIRTYRATLISTASSSTLTSSFARIDVFRVLDKQGKWHAVNTFGPNEDSQQIELGKVDAFCSRTLDITFGYPDFRMQAQAAGTADDKSLPIMRILTMNTINASNWGKDSAGKCLSRFEGDVDVLMIKDALVTDGVWETHVRNGANVFVEASRRLFPDCAEPDKSAATQNCPYQRLIAKRDRLFALNTTAMQVVSRCAGEETSKKHSAACEASMIQTVAGGDGRALARPSDHVASVLRTDEVAALSPQQNNAAFALDNGGGYEGTVVLTMSAMAILGSERRVRLLWVIPLWSKDAFYFRREIAQITYGSHIGNHALTRTRIPWFGPQLVLSVGEPAAISIDRKVAAQGRSGDLRELEKPGRSLSAEVNEGILGALRESVKSYDSTARALSRTIIRERYESDQVDVEFLSERSDPYERIFPSGE